MKMTDYDCAAHVKMVGLNHGIEGDEYLAACAAVKFDTHLSWQGHAEPTPDDRALIRAASERLNSNRA